MAIKKLSTAMLRGFQQVDGRQCKNAWVHSRGDTPVRVCGMGAVFLGLGSNPKNVSLCDLPEGMLTQFRKFGEEYGISVMGANDYGMCAADLIGMLKAIDC